MNRVVKGLHVLVTTCDSYLWALAPFAHQFNKYWSDEQPVVVGCYALPSEYGIELPDNFTIHQIQPENEPRERRSNGIIKFFNQVPDEYFIWMLEDFWLVDKVDVEGIALLYEFIQDYGNVLRIDLSRDRVRFNSKDIGRLGHLDLIESPKSSRYHWSHQGAIWNKSLMLPYMRPNEGARIEIYCTQRLQRDPHSPRVFGTKNWPLPYTRTIFAGSPRREHIRLNAPPPLPAGDIGELRELGLI